MVQFRFLTQCYQVENQEPHPIDSLHDCFMQRIVAISSKSTHFYCTGHILDPIGNIGQSCLHFTLFTHLGEMAGKISPVKIKSDNRILQSRYFAEWNTRIQS